MWSLFNLLFLAVCLNQLFSISETKQPVCSGDTGKNHRIALSINSIRNDKEEWVTKFSASQNMSVKPKIIDVDLTRSVIDCHQNYYINIQGIMKENIEEDNRGRLYFHSKCSSNAAIINDSRTLQKLKLDGQGAALTHRPLLDDEIFTVRIDRMDSKVDYAIGIGVTTNAPGTFDIPDHMNSLKTGTWMLYHTGLWHKSTQILPSYLRINLKDTKVGQRVGVMRSKSGTLHFFLDGVDQGPAASNMPDTVYGALELYGNLVQGTIVDE